MVWTTCAFLLWPERHTDEQQPPSLCSGWLAAPLKSAQSCTADLKTGTSQVLHTPAAEANVRLPLGGYFLLPVIPSTPPLKVREVKTPKHSTLEKRQGEAKAGNPSLGHALFQGQSGLSKPRAATLPDPLHLALSPIEFSITQFGSLRLLFKS